MTFPTLKAVGDSGHHGDDVSTVGMALPRGSQTGDLIVFVLTSAGPTLPTYTWPGGWTVEHSATNGTAVRTEVAWRVLDGTEVSCDVSWSQTQEPSWRSFRYTDHGSDVEVASTTGSSTAPDPPNLTPSWGAADNQWIAACCNFQGQRFISAWPTNYGSNQSTARWDNSNGSGTHVATRDINGASENPGAFTLSTSQAWIALTIAVKSGSDVGSPETSAYPKVRGVGAPAYGTGDIAPGLPDGWQADDLHLLFVEMANQLPSTPSGWTLYAQPRTGTAGGVAATGLAVFWRRAVAGDTAPTVVDPGDHTFGVIMGIYDVNTSAQSAWSDVLADGNDTTVDALMVANGVTTTVAETLVVTAFGWSDDAPVDGVQAIGYDFGNANTTLTEQRLQIDNGTSSGNGGGVWLLTGKKATAGASGTTTADVAGGRNIQGSWATFAVKAGTVGSASFEAYIID